MVFVDYLVVFLFGQYVIFGIVVGEFEVSCQEELFSWEVSLLQLGVLYIVWV